MDSFLSKRHSSNLRTSEKRQAAPAEGSASRELKDRNFTISLPQSGFPAAELQGPG
jgi:hypothetical protein